MLDDLIELALELIFEGAVEAADARRKPLHARLALAGVLLVLFAGVSGLLVWAGITSQSWPLIALGAALLAGLATGVYGSLEETAAVWQRDLTFEPQMEGYHRAQLLAGWHKAVERSLHWAKD